MLSTRFRLACPLLCGSILIAGMAQAQSSRQPQPSRTNAAPVVLTDQPFEIRSLGMMLRLPLGARLDTSSVGAANASFTLFAEDNTWILRLHSPQSRDKELTAPEVAEGLLEEMRSTLALRDPKTNKLRPADVKDIERDDNIVINGLRASRFYARLARVDGTVLVTGYTVFPIAPGKFAIFQIDCIDAEFEKVKNVYETILATVEIRDPAELAADRAAGVLAGERLLAQFNSEDLVNMLPSQPQFFRLYRPGDAGLPGDDKEVAYQVIEMRRGQRGELDPRKPKSRWMQADRDWGIIASVKSRFLDGNRVVDSESIYFLSLDRSAEAWSIHMAVKQGRDSAVFTETGARDGDAIEVNIIQPGQPQTTKRWRKPPEGYLSQVETLMLPLMLARTGASADFAFYVYQPQHNDIILRRDTLEQSEQPGQWIQLTRASEDSATDRAVLDADGLIVRKQMGSGVVMEAIKFDRLLSIWRGKNLPTD